MCMHTRLLTPLMPPPQSHPGADMGKVLMENKVQKMMDFVKNVLVLMDPAMQAAVAL